MTTPPTLTAAHAVIRGLRRPRDEVQLTQVLAASFVADPTLAAGFAAAVLAEAPHCPASLPSPPARLACRAEETTTEGRADLVFRDADHTWRIVVELKVDAAYGSDQITRYLGDMGGFEHEVLRL